ncbi:MAG TPA: TFIIB-type zinc ribbon-containing protein [Nitrososphaeraceae archaeon]|nr:TFIIB-type zinc ribbon-containing protein [Nitrososphaeraceae archaeon]
MIINYSTANHKKDRDNDDCSENPSYDLPIGKIQHMDKKPDSPKQNQILCSICKSDKIVTDPESGEIICSSCGMVISDKIEDTSHLERHVFTQGGQIEETRARTGAPSSLARHDMGLATMIGKEDRDASGQKIDSSINSTMQRLRAWDSRIHLSSSSDRNLNIAFRLLNTIKHKLGISDAIVEKVAYIYRKAQERGFVRGRSIPAVLAAALYLACRDLEVPKTMKDIAVASNVKRKYIARVYRQLILELDYKVPNPDPVKCIAKIANKSNLTEKTKRHALDIMEKVTENEISAGKDPMGLAATVLYISCMKTGESISQKEISNVAGVTEVTLRNRFKDIKKQLIDLN